MRAQGRASRIKVVLADDHVVVVEGLSRVLQPYFSVVGVVNELETLATVISATKPDVVLLDLWFRGKSSLQKLRSLVAVDEVSPIAAPRFVILTADESPVVVRAALEAGAVTVIPKGVGVQEVRLAVEAAASSPVPGHGAIAGPLCVQKDRRLVSCTVGGVHLSKRQIQVLTLLCEGLPRRSIAAHLGITVKGVDYLVRGAKDATGADELVGLMGWALHHNAALRSIMGPAPQTPARIAVRESPIADYALRS